MLTLTKKESGIYMVTIRDVAKKANVSVATVSRVLNGKGYVSEKTKKNVLSIIEELNYRPNNVARTLFHGKSKMIALFIPDIGNPFFPELARAVEDVTNKYDYTLVLCNTDQNLYKELEYIESLQQKSIDGIIIVSSELIEDSMEDINVPVVAVDRKFSEQITSVTVNNYEGAKIAVTHLLQNGCKKIAHITGPKNIITNIERLQGYLDTVSHLDWFHEKLIVNGEYNRQIAYTVARKLLTENPSIDGIFAGNDLMAVGALKAAEHLSISVPNELSIIGFDGIEMSEVTSPSLTTMEQPIYEIGKKTAELLISKIKGSNTKTQSYVFDTKLVERESTKKYSR